jgi:hypothetical protein
LAWFKNKYVSENKKGSEKMKCEDIRPFIGKNVKIAYQNGFVINGIIERVSEETIFFRTRQITSAIDIRSIASIVLKRGTGG